MQYKNYVMSRYNVVNTILTCVRLGGGAGEDAEAGGGGGIPDPHRAVAGAAKSDYHHHCIITAIVFCERAIVHIAATLLKTSFK